MRNKVLYVASIAFAAAVMLTTPHATYASEAHSNKVKTAISTSISGLIGENNSPNPTLYSTKSYLVGQRYRTVASNKNGINGDVYIAVSQQGYNGWLYQMNIIMTDKYGKVIHRYDNATGVAADGHWWAGSDITNVQLQIAPRNWFVEKNSFWVRCTF